MWLRNIVLLVMTLAAFSGLATADYFLRHEDVGKTRRSFLAKGVELNSDAAVQAVGGRDFVGLESLEKVGVDLGGLGESGDTPLIEAARIGDSKVVDYLIAKKSVINTLNLKSTVDGRNALLCALDNGNFSIVEKLMDAGAKMEGRWEEGVPLVMTAMASNDTKLFDFLIKQELSADEQNDDGLTSLALAVKENKDEWIIRLLDAGADVNQKGASGEALLLELIRSDRIELAKKLMTYKASVDVKNKAGETPLMIAIDKGDRETMLMLMDAGASKDAIDSKGRSISDRLVEHNNAEMMEYFSRKVGRGIPDEMVVKAFESERMVVLKGLLEKGGNVEAETGEGERLLKRAVLDKDQSMVDLLLTFNADPDGEILDALLGGEAAILESLLRNGADANESLEGDVGQPLSLVLKAQRYDFAEILLRFGADVDSRQTDGRTLIEEAEGRGDQKAVSILREYCADYREEVYSEDEAVEEVKEKK